MIKELETAWSRLVNADSLPEYTEEIERVLLQAFDWDPDDMPSENEIDDVLFSYAVTVFPSIREACAEICGVPLEEVGTSSEELEDAEELVKWHESVCYTHVAEDGRVIVIHTY